MSAPLFRVALIGARGRMGQAIATAAPAAGVAIAESFDLGDDLGARFAKVEAIVDFSAPGATAELIRLAVAARKPLVIGTTGHDTALKKSLLARAAKTACVWSGNYSIGVNLLFALTRRAAATLDAAYDIEIVEMHHRLKKDAPSGTAARLLEIVLEERKLAASAMRPGRHGLVGERSNAEVGVHAIRGGDVVGDHTVIFAGAGERIELTHRASDRGIFARGALRAARWAAAQKPGVYDMQDVLGLR